MAKEEYVEIDGRTVKLTNLDKVLWPDSGHTKADLVHYYASIAPYLLPHLTDRPLTVTRYPNGIKESFFYQKNCPDYAPEWINTFEVAGEDHTINYILAQDTATLVWLANQACIELHPALYTTWSGGKPTVVIFDLDPAEGATFSDVREVAGLLKKILDHLSLASFPKLSGASGLHIYVPVQPQYTFEQTSSWVGRIAQMLVQLYPERVTNERLVKNRMGKVYVDHLQNLASKTIVSVYSPRPHESAPVSMPIKWEELDEFEPNSFSLDTALERVRAIGDLFAPLLTLEQELDAALELFAVH